MQLPLHQVLSTDEVQQIRYLLENAPAGQGWADGRVTSGSQSREIKNNWQMPEKSPVTQQAQAIILAALQRHPLFLTAALPRRICPPMFNRYEGAHNAFGSHIDNALRSNPGQSGYFRTDLSCTLFLSEPGSYEGGELVMEHPGGSTAHKLPAGSLLLYPGTTVHRVTPVTRGARIASFFWVESMVRSAEQRQLLYELDMSIMQLRTKRGESEESVRLTGTYHNLLRMWAET
jgi:PKHD-type hydroxylase